MISATPIRESSLPLPLLRQGKVRDVYAVGEDKVLIVATDRVSAFDVVLDAPIPFKGAVLTQLSAWWFKKLSTHFGSTFKHHFITADSNEIIERIPALGAFRDLASGRSMLCHRTEVIPVECVVRGFLAGSAWKEYREQGTLAGVPLPEGLLESNPLNPPLFSPAAKASEGHDENIPVSAVVEMLGAGKAGELERLSRAIYEFGKSETAEKGIIVADTKFEFGIRYGEIYLIDEVLTPDSSRFWPASDFQQGRTQASFDKQPLRDWLESEKESGRWNGNAPGPALPLEVVDTTSKRYLNAFERIVGQKLDTVMIESIAGRPQPEYK